ncbi:MAG: polyphenol oxidase family protein [Ornithinimicrobium sp.]
MFHIREQVPAAGEARYDIEWAITDRHFLSDTADHPFTLGGRDPSWAPRIRANRAALGAALGVEPGGVRFMKQVHGAQVACVSGSLEDPEGAPTCDALITHDPTIAVAVLVADCTPVLLWDAAAGTVAAVHAGREGFLNGVLLNCLDQMRAQGAEEVQALVGPSICGRCYEVPPQMRAEAAAEHPSAYTVSWTGTAAIDISASVVAQLGGAGVPVRWLSGCTRESPNLFSHRADPAAGRFAAVVRLRERADAA